MKRRSFVAGVALAAAGYGTFTRRVAAASPHDFGLVGNGVVDDGPALQAAGDSAIASGAGGLRLPAGRYRIATPVSWVGQSGMRAFGLYGEGFGTKLLPETGEEAPMLRFAAFDTVEISRLTVIGRPGARTDALSAIQLYRVAHTSILNSHFYGVSSLVAGGAIVDARLTDLLVERCMFRGCTTHSGLNTPIIDNNDWRGLTVRSSRFIDYGTIDGIFHSKTPMASSAGFVRLGLPASLDNALGQSEAVLDDVRVDEGCYRALFVHANKPIDAIHVRGLQVNGHVGTGATALHVQFTKRLHVESSWIGYRKNAGGRAIGLLAVDDAEIEDVNCVDQMGLITADNRCGTVRLTRSTYSSLQSNASLTVVV